MAVTPNAAPRGGHRKLGLLFVLCALAALTRFGPFPGISWNQNAPAYSVPRMLPPNVLMLQQQSMQYEIPPIPGTHGHFDRCGNFPGSTPAAEVIQKLATTNAEARTQKSTITMVNAMKSEQGTATYARVTTVIGTSGHPEVRVYLVQQMGHTGEYTGIILDRASMEPSLRQVGELMKGMSKSPVTWHEFTANVIQAMIDNAAKYNGHGQVQTGLSFVKAMAWMNWPYLDCSEVPTEEEQS